VLLIALECVLNSIHQNSLKLKMFKSNIGYYVAGIGRLIEATYADWGFYFSLNTSEENQPSIQEIMLVKKLSLGTYLSYFSFDREKDFYEMVIVMKEKLAWIIGPMERNHRCFGWNHFEMPIHLTFPNCRWLNCKNPMVIGIALALTWALTKIRGSLRKLRLQWKCQTAVTNYF